MHKSPRLQQYDYTQQGAYFVTLSCLQQQNMLGFVDGDSVHCSEIGTLASAYWKEIAVHFPYVIVDEFVIMPNHVHGILIFEHAFGEGGVNESFGRPVPGSLSTIIRSYKAIVTREVRKQLGSPENIWQPGYYDRIIRGERELLQVRTYIRNNPLQWHLDELYRRGQ